MHFPVMEPTKTVDSGSKKRVWIQILSDVLNAPIG